MQEINPLTTWSHDGTKKYLLGDMQPVTGRFAHGQFARGRFALGQFAQNGPPKVRLG